MKYAVSPLLLLVITTVLSHAKPVFLQANTITPEVNKPMPEFTLSNVTHFKKSKASLNDFKGKWLFLDFWSTGCAACVKSFSKVSRFQREFKEQLNWVMIGINNLEYDQDSKAVEKLYERLKVKQDLQMISAYDSVLYKNWDISSVPHIYIIDPNGTLAFVTDGRDITTEKIKELVAGKKVTFFDKEMEWKEPGTNTLSAIEQSGSNKIMYSSMIKKWNGEKRQSGYEMDRYLKLPASEWQSGYQMSMVPLYWLYNTAYFGQCSFKFQRDSLYGKIYPFPVLQASDTTSFDFDDVYDVGKGLFNYNLIVPMERMTKETMMTCIQQDLERTFNYQASIETRQMPVWKLVATSSALNKVRTRGGESYNSRDHESIAAGFKVVNVSVQTFLNTLTYYLNTSEKPPFIDETNIPGNVDLTIDADLTNMEDVRRVLKKYDLDLVRGLKKMRVVLIRDL